MQFQFDARKIAPSQGREVWPGGWYQLVITGHDIKDTANGKGKRLVLSVVGNDDTHQKRGQTNEIGLNVGNDNATTVQIAYETLSAICWCVGKPAINDITELHGIPFYAFTPNEKDAQSNNWRGFKNMNGVDAIQLAGAGGGTTQRPGQQPQGQQQQQPNFQQPGQTAQPAQQQPGGWGQQQPAQQPAQQGQQPGWQQQQPAQQQPGGQPAWTPPGSTAAQPAQPQGGQQPGWQQQSGQAATAAPPWQTR